MTARAHGLGRALTARASFEDEHRSRLMGRVSEIEDAALADLIAEREARKREKAAWRRELAIRAAIRREREGVCP